MKFPCPICSSPTEVYDTRPHGNQVKRRRRCENNHRFNTYESRVGQVWNQDHHVVPIAVDDYDEQDLRADLKNEQEAVMDEV